MKCGSFVCAVAIILCCSSCRASGSSAERSAPPCPPIRHLLLNARLSRLALSQPFDVPPATTPWVSTTNRPDPEQLFGGVGGIVDISVSAAGTAPRITTDPQGSSHSHDPTVDLRKTGAWYRLPVVSGSWQVYTVDLGASSVDVSVIACADRKGPERQAVAAARVRLQERMWRRLRYAHNPETVAPAAAAMPPVR